MQITDNSHGSPYDRGQADCYYGRRYNPNMIKDGKSFKTLEMNEQQINEYTHGFDTQLDRKDWG